MNELKRAPDNVGKMLTIFSDKRGRVVGVNKRRLSETPFLFNTNPPNTVTKMLVPLQTSQTREMRLSKEGPMQITELTAKKTNILTAGSGTITVAGGGGVIAVAGIATKFLSELEPGDAIVVTDDLAAVQRVNVDLVTNNTALAVTAATAFPNACTAQPYQIWKRFDLCLLQLYARDGTTIRNLCSNWIHRDTITGSRGQAYPLAEALYADETRGLAIMARDISANAAAFTNLLGNGMQVTFPAAKYTEEQNDPSLKRIRERLKSTQMLSLPFFYTLDSGVVVLSRLGYSESLITVGEDHHFELHMLSAAFGVGEAPNFSIDIVDLAKGESILSAPSGRDYLVPQQLLFGNNGFPYRLPEPIMVYAGQKLLVKIQETGGDVASNVYLTLGGKVIPVRAWS